MPAMSGETTKRLLPHPCWVNRLLEWDNKQLTLLSEEVPSAIPRTNLELRESWQRPPPAFVADFSGVQLTNSLMQTVKLDRHGTFRSTMTECLMTGTHHFHMMLQKDGAISLHDTDLDRMEWRLNYFLSNHPRQSAAWPQIASSDDTFVCTTTNLDPSAVVYIEQPVFFGTPVEPDNFGMWIILGLPSANDFVRNGQGRKYFCWLRFDWQRKMLAFMGIRDEQIIIHQEGRPYACADLTMHQYTHVDVTPTASDLALFAELRNRCPVPNTRTSDKIFLSRRSFSQKAGYRQLLNEDELINALKSHGFLIVEPELLDFESQISLFGCARAIVGVGGAALFNTVFCRPGTAVISIESSQSFVYGHSNLFASLQLHYGFIFGRQDEEDFSPIHKRWTIDVARAVQYIRAFI